jgi:hypothetical protein
MSFHKIMLGFVILMSQVGWAAPKTYPLVCRGGAGTLGFASGMGNGNVALFYFQKANGPAGAGLAPGQCSWVDRKIGPNEPPCLKQSNAASAAWIFPDRLAQSYFNSSNAPWLRDFLRADSFQTFQVYNPGNGDCFYVNRIGP